MENKQALKMASILQRKTLSLSLASQIEMMGVTRYKYFEKRRIVDGTPKSMTRLENEKKYPKGLPRVDENRPVYVTVGPGEDPYQVYLESM